jgi:DDE family transposase
VEGFHGEAKTWHGLARAARRGLANMQIQAYLTAAAINLKRLAVNEAEIIPAHRLDGGEDVGVVETLVVESRQTLVVQPPAMADTPFLSYSAFVLEIERDPLVRMGLGCGLQRARQPFFT